MAEHISRTLRDGSLEGEHAVALTVKDSLQSPFGSHAFDHFLCSAASNISSGRSQARQLVLVALDRSPSFYVELLESKGLSSDELDKWLRIIDCYSDPLGWKERLLRSRESSIKGNVCIYKDVKDIDHMVSLILKLGEGVAIDGKAYFSVAIDSVSELLRHASLHSVTRFISNIRSHAKVSSIFWLIHSDLHESRQSAALEYISTMVASVETILKPVDCGTTSKNLLNLEEHYGCGKFNVRLKRRNGRVKILSEQFHIDQFGIRFSPVTMEVSNSVQNLVPKVQFNLRLSEKERADRAKVVLPFEHQGTGKTINIYDGRQSHPQGQQGSQFIDSTSITDQTDTQRDLNKGEIHYLRDSDDELPDSDEDPDDDLDI